MIFFSFIIIFFLFLLVPFFSDPRTIVKLISIITFLIGLSLYWKSKLPKGIVFLNSLFLQKNLWVWINISLLGLHLFILSQLHLRSFFLTENDFVSMSEILNETIKGNFFHDSFHGDMDKGNYLAHHFSPSLILLTPFLYLSPTRMGYSYGLIFFSLLGVYFFFLNIKTFKLKYKIFLITFYILNLYNYRLFTSYHFEILSLTFFLAWFYYKKNQNRFLEFLLFLFLLGLKEDISIYMSLFSFYFLFEKKYLSFIYYFFTPIIYHFLFIPFAQSFLDQSTTQNWLHIWEGFGNSIPKILLFFLKNPKIIFLQIWNKKKTLVDLYGNFSFLPLASFKILLTASCIVCIHLLSSRIWHNSFYHYYAYSILPSFWIGVLDFFSKKKQLSQTTLFLFLAVSLYFGSLDKHYPLSYPTPSEDFEIMQEIISKIPFKAEIQVSFQLGALLPRHLKLYPLKNLDNPKEYLLYAPSQFQTESEQKLEAELKKMEVLGKIILVIEKKRVKLYKKGILKI